MEESTIFKFAIYLVAPAIGLLWLWDKNSRSFRRYCQEHEGRIFLVMSEERGGREHFDGFVRDHLPNRIEALWMDSGMSIGDQRRILDVCRPLRLPCLVVVSKQELRVATLHERFDRLAAAQGKNEDKGPVFTEMVEDALEEARAS